ncbi:hypothetical protein RI129_011744 [Pyrocoelia pectoralis]|uniref:DDE Tnp4 domain-containing protein n=1 Tax=Pyrocoelia pectoralis TaxID=417401 RepID=A0AAN7V0Q1_9COLE
MEVAVSYSSNSHAKFVVYNALDFKSIACWQATSHFRMRHLHISLKFSCKKLKYSKMNRALFVAINNLEQNENAVRRNRFYRRMDAFDMPENQFIKHFRLSKPLVRDLILRVSRHIPAPTRRSAIDVQTKVLLALNFFATGSYQLPVGSNIYLGVKQSSVSRSLAEVVEALNQQDIFSEWVSFPRNVAELTRIRAGFFEKYNFPGVIGCIDCTHVAIVPPKKDDLEYPEYLYVNRKRYHSINVQLICDSDLKILHVNARFPGSTNDAYIWRNCAIEPLMRQLQNNIPNSYFLLGDSGYPLRPWLLTPIQNAAAGSAEENYNMHQTRARATIERCNGVLKMRFRCLLKHRVLHYTPEKCSKIINACVILHNMCIANNVPLMNENDDEFDMGIIGHPLQNNVIAGNNPDLVAGRELQRRLVQNYFR